MSETRVLESALRHVYGCPYEPFACDHPDHASATELVAEMERSCENPGCPQHGEWGVTPEMADELPIELPPRCSTCDLPVGFIGHHGDIVTHLAPGFNPDQTGEAAAANRDHDPTPRLRRVPVTDNKETS